MTQGDAYNLEISITNRGEALDVETVEQVEVTLLDLTRSYPEEVAYADGKFLFPVTQAETFRLPPMCPMQVRVKFKGGDVVGSPAQTVNVAAALSRAVL